MNYCEGGDLFNEIMSRGKFAENDAKIIISQLLMAADHCHQKNVVIRSLSPENIFLEKSKSIEKIQIYDFFLATILTDNKKLTEKIG